ncbi:thioredoxin family protein [Bacillaceae bacterium IKA-2]|nr:thioredoxin family protein [Bacillaceae bacterium IKA-2]
MQLVLRLLLKRSFKKLSLWELLKEIKVLGTGCKKCKQLEERVKEVLEETSIEANIEKVEDIQEIIKYGVMSTPALVIDGKVVSSGKVLSVKELKKILV